MATIGELMLRVGIDASGMNAGMSDAIKGLESFEGSATRAGKAMDKAFSTLGIKDSSAAMASQMLKVQSAFEFLEKSYKSGKISAEDYAKATDAVKAKLEALGGIAPKITVDIKAIGSALQGIGASGTNFQIGGQIAELQKNLATLKTAYKEGSISAADFAKAQATVAAEMDKLTRVPVATLAENLKAVSQAGTTLQSIGTTLSTAITLPLVGIAAASIKMAGDFEASMNKVKALGGITGDSLAALEKQAMDLGAATKFSAKEAADGMAQLAAAGLNTSQIMATMPAVLALAAAGEMSVGDAARVSADLMGQFGIKAEGLGHAIDVIALAANESSATVMQMTESFKTVGAVAHSAGLGLEDVSAALTILAQGGRKAEQAGTDLRSMLGSLLDPSKEAADAMKALRIHVLDATGQLKPFGEVIKELGKAAGNTSAIFKIFGREGATGAALFANSSQTAFEKLRKTFNDTSNDAQKMADIMNTGIKGAFEKMSGSIETLGIVVGKALEPATVSIAGFVEAGANKLAEMAQDFGKLPVPIQNTALALVGLAAAAGPALYAFGGIATGVTQLIATGKEVASWSGKLENALRGVAGYGGPAAAAMDRLNGTFTSISTSAALLGVGIAGTAAAITALELGSVISEFSQLGSAIGRAVEAFSEHNAIEKWTAASKGMVTKDTIQEMSLLETGVRTAASGIAALAAEMGKTNWYEWASPNSLGLIGQAVRNLAKDIDALATSQIALNKGPSLKESPLVSFVTNNMRRLGVEARKMFDEQDKNMKAAEDGAKRLAQNNAMLAESQKKAALEAQKHAVALQLQKDKAVEAWGALTKYEDALRGLNNIKLAELTLGGPNFKEYLEGLKAYGVELEKLQTHLQSFQSNEVGTRNLARAMADLGAQIGNVATAYEHFGMTSGLAYKDAVAANKKALDAILADTNSSLAQKTQAMAIAAERDIAVARAAGEKISDAAILSAQRIKAAYSAQNMDLEQAWKTLGVTTTEQFRQIATAAEVAYEKIRNADGSTNQDILKADAGRYAAQLNAQEAAGDRATETQKRYLAKLVDDSQHGIDTLSKQWDLFANHIGDAVGKGLDDLALDLLTGKKIGNIKDVFRKLWDSVAKSFVDDMITPVTKKFTAWITSMLLDFTGLGDAAKKAGQAIKAGLLNAVSADGSPILAGGINGTGLEGAVPTGIAGANGTVLGGAQVGAGKPASGSGLGSVMTGNIIGAVGVAVDAAAGITAGLQMAHLISTAGHIEVNTREMSTVMWQTGAESLQGLAKLTMQWTMFANDRLADIRDALFNPVANVLEQIRDRLMQGNIISTGIMEGVEEGNNTGEETAENTGEVSQHTETSSEHLKVLEDRLATINRVLAQAKADLKTDNAALAAQLKKDSDKLNPLYVALKAKVDADNLLIANSLADQSAVTTAIKGEQSAIANAERGITQAQRDSATKVSNSVGNSSNTITGSITQTSGEVVNAIGQSGSEVANAVRLSVGDVTKRLESMSISFAAFQDAVGGIPEELQNSYNDLKSTLIGTEQHSTKVLGEYFDEFNKNMNEGIFGKADNKEIGMNDLEKQGFVDLQNKMNDFSNWEAQQKASTQAWNQMYPNGAGTGLETPTAHVQTWEERQALAKAAWDQMHPNGAVDQQSAPEHVTTWEEQQAAALAAWKALYPNGAQMKDNIQAISDSTVVSKQIAQQMADYPAKAAAQQQAYLDSLKTTLAPLVQAPAEDPAKLAAIDQEAYAQYQRQLEALNQNTNVGNALTVDSANAITQTVAQSSDMLLASTSDLAAVIRQVGMDATNIAVDSTNAIINQLKSMSFALGGTLLGNAYRDMPQNLPTSLAPLPIVPPITPASSANVVQNFTGVMTDQEYQAEIAKRAAESLVKALR